MQDLIRKQPGVVSTRVGYTGGKNDHPTYRNHPGPRRGHRDRVRPRADRLPRAAGVLLPDPRSDDEGPPGQRRRQQLPVGDLLRRRRAEAVALDTIADVEASGLWPGKVVTEVTPAVDFWEAEPEHQDYLESYPNGYTCHFPRAGWKLPKREKASQ